MASPRCCNSSLPVGGSDRWDVMTDIPLVGLAANCSTDESFVSLPAASDDSSILVLRSLLIHLSPIRSYLGHQGSERFRVSSKIYLRYRRIVIKYGIFGKLL